MVHLVQLCQAVEYVSSSPAVSGCVRQLYGVFGRQRSQPCCPKGFKAKDSTMGSSFQLHFLKVIKKSLPVEFDLPWPFHTLLLTK